MEDNAESCESRLSSRVMLQVALLALLSSTIVSSSAIGMCRCPLSDTTAVGRLLPPRTCSAWFTSTFGAAGVASISIGGKLLYDEFVMCLARPSTAAGPVTTIPWI